MNLVKELNNLSSSLKQEIDMKKKKELIYAILFFLIMIMVLIVRKSLEPVKPFEQNIIIEDEYLDDTNVFDMDYSPNIGVQNYSVKGMNYNELVIPSNVYEKSFFYYETQISQAVRFRLTPKKNGDYIVTIPKIDGLYVLVLKHNLLRYNSEKTAFEILDKKEDKKQYQYNLEKDSTYDIYVINVNGSPINASVEIEQNNWIHAPYGGYAEYGKKRVSFLSQKLLFETRKKMYSLLGDADPNQPDPDLQMMSEEQLHQFAENMALSITQMVGAGDANDFLEHYRSIRSTKEFLQTLIVKKFNIMLITSNSGKRYSLSYDEWNEQNYFSKYRDSKRASKYIAFSSIPDEDQIIKDKGGEWVHYIK